jgi:hypothetical protein
MDEVGRARRLAAPFAIGMNSRRGDLRDARLQPAVAA